LNSFQKFNNMTAEVCDPLVLEENKEADDIAQHITKLLIEAFEAKEHRKPTNEEVAELLEELTEERIAMLMGEISETTESVAEEESVAEDGVEGDVEEGEESGDQAADDDQQEQDNTTSSEILTSSHSKEQEKRVLDAVNDENLVNQDKRVRVE
jgi:hypothetical protein